MLWDVLSQISSLVWISEKKNLKKNLGVVLTGISAKNFWLIAGCRNLKNSIKYVEEISNIAT